MAPSWTALVLALAGCIFYEPTDAHPTGAHLPPTPGLDHADDRLPGWSEPPEAPADTFLADDLPPAAPWDLTLDPWEAGPGDVLIVSLHATGGLDLASVTALQVYGDAGVRVLAIRPDGPERLLAALAVPAEAPPGPQDVLVALGDGRGVWLEDAFDVVPGGA